MTPIAILAVLMSSPDLSQPRLSRPDIHGNEVTFIAEGDIWLADLTTGNARRMTTHEGNENSPKFSPDGTKVAFTGQYEGGNDVYVMPLDGGIPKRLTYEPAGGVVQGWTPDGKSVLYRSGRYQPTRGQNRLWSVGLSGSQLPKLLPVPTAEFGAINAAGKLAYVPVSFEWANWFRYRAGGQDDIWLADLKGNFKRLTNDPGVDTTPVWCGDWIYFVSERDGHLNLWRMRGDGGGQEQLTRYADGGVRYPASDGKRVVFQHGMKLAIFNPSDKSAKDLSIQLSSDHIHERPQRYSMWDNQQSLELGPTGKRMAFESRGQIVTVPVESGEMHVIENSPGSRASLPAWSPDGKKIAFISDRTGENEIWVRDAVGSGESKQLTTDLKANVGTLIWSPDGNWIGLSDREQRIALVDASIGAVKIVDQSRVGNSYDSSPSFQFSPDGRFLVYQYSETDVLTNTRICEIATMKTTPVAPPYTTTIACTFDPTSKFLVLLAETKMDAFNATITNQFAYDNTVNVFIVPLAEGAGSPFAVKNDEEGTPQTKEAPTPGALSTTDLPARMIPVPIPAGRYRTVLAIPGKILLVNGTSPAGGPADLLSFDIASRSTTKIMSGISGASLSADRSKLMVFAQGQIGLFDASTPPTSFSSGVKDFSSYTLVSDPRAEWKAVFNEAWRIARDFYYDPNMQGVNWKAVKTKYETRFDQVSSRQDLSALLKDMVSELNTGHAYIVDPTPGFPSPGYGYLGADYEPASSGVKITRIYRGDQYAMNGRSPLLEPGLEVKEGMYLLAINGQSLEPGQDPNSLMIGRGNQIVAVTVNSTPSMEGSRVVRVRALSSENDLRYRQWVEDKAEYVRKNGGDNIGYAHIPSQSLPGLSMMMQRSIENRYKDAVIYDVRFNGGGYTAMLMLDFIAARPLGWLKARYGDIFSGNHGWGATGYQAALCNEQCFSDSEIFIELWKKMKLGPVVGTTTGGGAVGSGGGYSLLDGGLIYTPNYAWFTDDGWIIEGQGATPTIEVVQDPAALMAGRDPQLDAAIKAMKDQIARNPVKRPKQPPFVNKALPGGGP